MRTIANFLRYTGYINFINRPISRVLLLILVHVQLQGCLLRNKAGQEGRGEILLENSFRR